MADTEGIMQLGIEAARAGDKEEARNLFRLLTRETPDDAQAWLWLAGVAEDREEKRAALEQVLRLEPSNDLARQGLDALGGPASKAPAPIDTTPDFGFDDTFALDTANDVPPAPPARPEPKPEPARTRELTPDEEFAMSLDSLGSLTSSYNEQASQGGDLADFNIPDFGDDDSMDISAYMNRERIDPSQVEVTAEEIKKPTRKPMTKGGVSGESKSRLKDKNGKRRTSSGMLPLLIIALGVVAIAVFAIWFLNRDSGDTGPVAGVPTAVATQPGGGVVPTLAISPTNPLTDTTTVPPGGEQPGGEQPGGQPGGETPGGQPGGEQPTQPPFNPPPDAQLGSVQPNLLPANGSVPVVVDNWYFNYGGVSGVADGNAINFQPQGRWVVVGPLMFDGTLEGRTIPTDLMVLKDAQGRVYRPNPDASEAFLNTYPGSYSINLKQPAPVGVNFTVPLMFDVAPDATDLVLFSPLDTSQGYYVRANPY